jgi:Co/Zn/Cd efflux system component
VLTDWARADGIAALFVAVIMLRAACSPFRSVSLDRKRVVP